MTNDYFEEVRELPIFNEEISSILYKCDYIYIVDKIHSSFYGDSKEKLFDIEQLESGENYVYVESTGATSSHCRI